MASKRAMCRRVVKQTFEHCRASGESLETCSLIQRVGEGHCKLLPEIDRLAGIPAAPEQPVAPVEEPQVEEEDEVKGVVAAAVAATTAAVEAAQEDTDG